MAEKAVDDFAKKAGIDIVGVEGIDPMASNYRDLIPKITGAGSDMAAIRAKAVRDGERFDVWTSNLIIVGYAIPAFLFAILLIVVFAGGTGNPFVFLYLLQIAVGAVLLRGFYIWSIVAITTATTNVRVCHQCSLGPCIAPP